MHLFAMYNRRVRTALRQQGHNTQKQMRIQLQGLSGSRRTWYQTLWRMQTWVYITTFYMYKRLEFSSYVRTWKSLAIESPLKKKFTRVDITRSLASSHRTTTELWLLISIHTSWIKGYMIRKYRYPPRELPWEN